SSFSRDRLGALLSLLLNATQRGDVEELRILYAPAAFSTALVPDSPTLIGSAELLGGFEGPLVDPDRAVTAIVGLGYEPGRALGAVELLEPQRTVLLRPVGVDSRYDKQVAKVNAALLGGHGGSVPLEYDVLQPRVLLEELRRLLRGISTYERAVLVPLG